MSTDFPYSYMPRPMYYTIAILLAMTCMAAAWGSITIVHLVIRYRKFRKSTFHRIMLGMALCDLFSSIGLLTAPFAVPKSTTGLPLALGNDVTCQVQTMLIVQSLGSVHYSTTLSLYFLLIVKYGMSEKRMSRALEPWIHIVTWLFPLATNLASLLLGSTYSANPVFGICTDECDRDNTGLCLKRSGIQASSLPVTLPLVISIFPASILSITFTWMVYRTVRDHEEASNKHCIESYKQSKAVAKRAICYTCANLNALFISALMIFYPHIVGDLATLNERPQVSILALVMLILYPIQGFFNGVIYCRPAIVRWRAAFPNRSQWWAYRKMLAGEVAPPVSSLLCVGRSPPGSFSQLPHRTQLLASNTRTRFSSFLESPSAGIVANDNLVADEHSCRTLHAIGEEEKKEMMIDEEN